MVHYIPAMLEHTINLLPNRTPRRHSSSSLLPQLRKSVPTCSVQVRVGSTYLARVSLHSFCCDPQRSATLSWQRGGPVGAGWIDDPQPEAKHSRVERIMAWDHETWDHILVMLSSWGNDLIKGERNQLVRSETKSTLQLQHTHSKYKEFINYLRVRLYLHLTPLSTKTVWMKSPSADELFLKSSL